MFKYAILALAALSLAATVQAKEPDVVTVSVTVPYGDLDLASDTGAAVLQSRIARAVKVVCARADSRELHAWSAWQKCRTEAMEGAAQQLASAHVNLPLMASAR